MRTVNPRLVTFLTIGIALIVHQAASHGATAEDLIQSLSGLSPDARLAKLVDGAKREGKVTFYASLDGKDAKELLEGFKRRYPFLEYQHYRTGGIRLINKAVSESKAKRYEADVMSVTGHIIYEFMRGGLAAKYISPERRFIRKDFVDKDGYWTGFDHVPVVVGFNTKLVTSGEMPKRYEDFLNPKWRGNLAIDEDDQDVYAALIDAWGQERTDGFFKGLRANQVSLRRGRVLQSELVAAGEIPVSLFLHSHLPLALKGKGAPVDFLYLPPFVTKIITMALAKFAPHPHSAILLSDYLLSREAQQMIVSKLDREGVREGVEGTHREIHVKHYAILNPDTAGPRAQELRKRFEEMMK